MLYLSKGVSHSGQAAVAGRACLVIQPNKPWTENRPKEQWCNLHSKRIMAVIHANVAPAAVKPLAPASVCVRVGHSNKLMLVK